VTLEQAGKRLARARESLRAAMNAAETEALAALSEGATEAEVARACGVDRMTVRKWAGKR
jgi:DNA-binding CsgD family transcriptional regulator